MVDLHISTLCHFNEIILKHFIRSGLHCHYYFSAHLGCIDIN